MMAFIRRSAHSNALTLYVITGLFVMTWIWILVVVLFFGGV